MLRSALFIALKDVQYMLREKETVAWTFVMPIVFFYFIGTVTAGFGGGGGDRKDSIALEVPADAGFLVDQLVRRLEEQNYQVARPESAEELDRYRRRLAVPVGFTRSVEEGEPVELLLRRRGEGTGADFDQLRVSRAVYTLLADVVLAGENGRQISPEVFEEIVAMPRALKLAVRPAGKRREIPTGFEQTIPGTMVMFTMMLLLTSGAMLLMIERRQGLLRRLASAPISRASVVAGKWGGKMALGLVQITFGMAAGTVLFKMDWGPALPMVLLLLLAWAAFNASLGILLGTLARTEGQAIGIGVVSTMALAALGGCWWPIEVTPLWMQKLALLLPTGWTMDAMHRLVSFRDDPGSALPHLMALAAAALITGGVATRKFRFL
ncbi:MAG: ABC transporter permease [Planctomycetota bacterium]